MNVFDLRQQLIADYRTFVESFIAIRDGRVREKVEASLESGLLWPEPFIGLNPAFAPGGWIDELVTEGLLHPECSRIFRRKADPTDPGKPLRLHQHQVDAIRAARAGKNYVLTTGTGSGKSLAYIIPIVDHVLRNPGRRGIKAIVVYPMNALANSQIKELERFLSYGYPDGRGPVRFKRYTGQEKDEERNAIIADPPDILLTNYVMLELILTRVMERQLVGAARGLKFLVLDELHTYRGRQGADVALLARRTRDACEATDLQVIGTSATMIGGGTFDEQKIEVARVASLLFGSTVEPDCVIGEALRRATPPAETSDPTFIARLKERLTTSAGPHTAYEAFLTDPLTIWIESTFGITTEEGTGRLIRVKPRMIRGKSGAAAELAALAGANEETCVGAIQQQLLSGHSLHDPETGFPVFAFRLHQFLSRGETVYASVEPEADRYLTVAAQQFVPGDRGKVLLPLVFCRECGQEYYTVRWREKGAPPRVEARRLEDRSDEDEGTSGYLYLSTGSPWPEDPEELQDRLPEDWFEERKGVLRVKYSQRKHLPVPIEVAPDGRTGAGGLGMHFVPSPFRFCLNCGVTYGGRQASDFSKLTTLGSGGRSTATTILSLSAIRHLRRDEALKPEARKLLSFTDNRQDAALQAGHFNDFVEVGLLRSALYRAALAAGDEGLSHDQLTQQAFTALNLPFQLYASNPDARFAAKADTEKTFRDVLGYRLYIDQQRGWRVTSPNLEQCDLLRIEYVSLKEACAAQDLWDNKHAALVTASPETREAVCRVLLNRMRQTLAIKVDFLDRQSQERLQQASSQRLVDPWAIDENERMMYATIVLPRSRRNSDSQEWQFLSSRSLFGQYLRRVRTFPEYGQPLKTRDTDEMIPQLLDAMQVAGLVERVREPEGPDDRPGYQVSAAGMRWVAGPGKAVQHDPTRVPRPPADGGRVNEFFLSFYRTVAKDGQGLEAREHTAQVLAADREERERRFRTADLPILFCSPTMELGVDIAELNVVGLRNVPPTPANYAQRSGRAGRSGQPALVFTYCSTGSPHDQFFYRRPQMMVAGQVTPPRLDLANEDLIRAHLDAIWLAVTGQSLGKSLQDLLDLSGEDPTLKLQDSVRAGIDREAAKARAREGALRVLGTIQKELETAGWWGETWLDDALKTVIRRLDDACNRWRDLYRAALAQAKAQQRVILDATRSHDDKQRAQRLRREAEAQLKLLTAGDSALMQSDFYSYRYFASEGFLPGYSFPRLPLSAYIPARRAAKGKDEYLNRPRFLAISEFGPRNFLYHEGSRYVVERVILPPPETGDAGAEQPAITRQAKLCEQCGYLRPIADGVGRDKCENCEADLGGPLTHLFRLQNVTTRRRDRINSDEEERQRKGYEVRSAIRFSSAGGQTDKRTAIVQQDGKELAVLTYGSAATIWRINYGWKRRQNPAELGFVLDVERGYWAKRQDDPEEDDEDAPPMGARTQRVIPFVEDHKNCLIFEPRFEVDDRLMASLEAALKNAIQVRYELEETELAAEALPDDDHRRYILFYEASEGGAGVLRRLVEEPGALAEVARGAIDLCHYDPDTGADKDHAPGADERCEAACYDCLLSYVNQTDHTLLDRALVLPVLQDLAAATVAISPGPLSRAEQFDQLNRLSGSSLEKKWLRFIFDGSFRLPTHGQKLFEAAGTRPDFLYAPDHLAVYVDGPFHDYPERAKRDADKQTAMEDLGWIVVRFRHDEEWESLVKKYPSVFGTGS